MKRKHEIVCILLVLALFLPLLTACDDHYDTTDLAEYGHIHGNGKKNDKRAQEDFDTYFPVEIDPTWEDVHYHYHALNDELSSTMCCEIELEFVIPDQAAFDAYVEAVAPIEEFRQFPYDEAFLEYVHNDREMRIRYDQDEQTGEKLPVFFDYAHIVETLIAPAERRVLIVVLHVSETEYVENADWFFKRFHIDPIQYALDMKEVDPQNFWVDKISRR